MLSRDQFTKEYSLPLYMNNMHDRGSMNRITEKSLRTNKYKEGNFASAESSFIPKKSFNKIININMINSHDFKEKINDDYIIEKKEKLKTEIEKKNKDGKIEYLKNIGYLTQFDNFTYKTIPIQKRSCDNNWFKKSLKKLFSICY